MKMHPDTHRALTGRRPATCKKQYALREPPSKSSIKAAYAGTPPERESAKKSFRVYTSLETLDSDSASDFGFFPFRSIGISYNGRPLPAKIPLCRVFFFITQRESEIPPSFWRGIGRTEGRMEGYDTSMSVVVLSTVQYSIVEP